jgi:hypothetical protein
VRVESWRRYQAIFGSFVSYGFLAYAVKAFLENGGRTCYVVRVAGQDAEAASLVLVDGGGAPLLRIRAKNEGTWGNALVFRLISVSAPRKTFSLAVTGPGNDREVYNDLTLANCADVLARGDGRSLPPSRWISAEVIAPANVDALPDRLQTPAFAGGKDGLASLTRDDLLGTLSDGMNKRGLGALERTGDVGIVCMPDIHHLPVPEPPKPQLPPPPPVDPCLACGIQPPADAPIPPADPVELPPRFSINDVRTMQRAMIEHCELQRDRVAILDAPVHDSGGPYSPEDIIEWREELESDRGFAALYYPWVKVLDPLKLGGSPVRAVPPCGHVAGLYARTDVQAGVHKAPANGEAVWAEDVTVEVGAEVQGVLNPRGINCLRPLPGRGIVVYGARTLSNDSDWRYVNVRRLLLMIEEAIDLATQWAVFEPHDEALRIALVQSITGFLDSLWRRGMLAGATREQAFYVKCDDTVNPPESVAAGRVITEIGVAPAIPAEFVIIRVGRTAGEIETVER